MTNKYEFTSHDLYVSAYFHAVGIAMKRTDRNKGRVLFVFEFDDEADAEALKTAWFTASGMVSAVTYANSIKLLKSLCHQR